MGNKKELGNSALLVSPLTFGGNVFGWTLNEQESFKILDAFFDSGFNFIDSADTYSTWVPSNRGRRMGNHYRQLVNALVNELLYRNKFL